MLHQKIVLILGSGPRVGRHVSQAFTAKGYKVAVASRTFKEEDKEPGQTHFPVDLSKPSSIPQLFAQVQATLGIPHVVVYNASAGAANDADNPFSISLSDFEHAISITTTSVFAAAQQATTGFQQLPDSASKTFIFTGNALNSLIIAPLTAAGVGKSGSAHMMQSAAQLSGEQGFKFAPALHDMTLKLTSRRFYYADERNSDGSPVYGKISGEAHGDHYVELAERKEQGPWLQTFVRGVGYKQF